MSRQELKKMFIKEDIENEINRLVIDDGYTYLEAIMEYCERKEIDPRDVPVILPKSIKDHLEVECVKNKLVKGKIPVSIENYT